MILTIPYFTPTFATLQAMIPSTHSQLDWELPGWFRNIFTLFTPTNPVIPTLHRCSGQAMGGIPMAYDKFFPTKGQFLRALQGFLTLFEMTVSKG